MTDDARVDEAIENFSLEEYLSSNASAPQDEVKVYLDADSAYRIAKLEEERTQRKASEGESIGGFPDLDSEIEELRERIERSAMIVRMRAMYGAERQVIAEKITRKHPVTKNMTEEEKNFTHNNRRDLTIEAWAREAITEIETPDGRVAKGPVDEATLASIQAALYDTEWQKIVALFSDLSLAGELFDARVDAGFPGGAAVEE